MKTPLRMALVFGAALVMPAIASAAGQPSVADEKTSAVGSLWFGYSFLSDDNIPLPFDDSYAGLGGDFRVNIPAGGGMSFQLDVQGESAFVDNTSKNYTGSVLTGAHLSWRNPEAGLIGILGGVGNGFNAFDETTTAFLLGAEGQIYLPDWTFYAQLGYMDADEVDTGTPDAFRDAWFGRGVARFFIASNVLLQGEVSYADGENDTDSDNMDAWGWGARFERTIPSMDGGFFLAYQGTMYDNENEARTLTEHTIRLGLNFAFGVEGQKYVDRHGATLDLPNVARWSAYGVDMLD